MGGDDADDLFGSLLGTRQESIALSAKAFHNSMNQHNSQEQQPGIVNLLNTIQKSAQFL